MFWFTNSVKTSKLFINNTFPNVLCRKAPRIGPPFNGAIVRLRIEYTLKNKICATEIVLVPPFFGKVS